MKPNDFRPLWLGMTRIERERLVAKVATTYGYLQKLSGGFAMPSMAFAWRLKRVLPALNLAGFERATQEAGHRARR